VSAGTSAVGEDAGPAGRDAHSGWRALPARHPLARFVLRRTAVGLLLLFAISILVFIGTQILPGDAAASILGRNATPKALAVMNRALGLDRPPVTRYFLWISDTLHGNLGRSLVSGEPVSSIIGYRIVDTLILASAASIIMIPVAVALGIAAGRRSRGALDGVVSAGSLAMIAVPEFIIGTLLIYFLAVRLQLLPAVSVVVSGGPLDNPAILVLPTATLVIVGSAYIIRMVRAGVGQVMRSDYIEMARLNGVPERRVVLRHALRNALAPTVQVVALTLQWLVGGLFIVETVFAYPGIGAELVQAVIARDIPIVQSVALLIAAVYIAINILADVVIVLLVPKLRTAA
jgi:peptide/nickel transport system permease protein